MLRIHCMQLFYNLSDPAMEDTLYEIESMCNFSGLTLSGPIPDETTILNFLHLLESNQLSTALFEEINKHFAGNGLAQREGTIADATIISAPTSTKNKKKECAPEMHQTKKRYQWHFGMKMHIGTDDTLGLIHSLDITSANQHDLPQQVNCYMVKRSVFGETPATRVRKSAKSFMVPSPIAGLEAFIRTLFQLSWYSCPA